MNLNHQRRLPLAVAMFLAPAFLAGAVTFTSNTNIAYNNTNFDSQPIVITNCTVTVDGAHVFGNVDVQSGGVLTCSSTPSGVFTNVINVVDEEQVFSSTNPAVLDNPDVVIPTIVVTDLTGTNVYVLGTDYELLLMTNGSTAIIYFAGTTIPDGSEILVSYQALVVVQAGLNLTVTTNVQVEAGGAIDADGAGYGPALGPGPGTTMFTSSPYPHNAGSGGGFGGSGGASDSGAPGGAGYGVFKDATTESKGSGGGSGSNHGGTGGGAISIVVGGLLQVDGEITANGLNGTNLASGGGAGGGIQLSAGTISGSGVISARGGGGDLYSGGGGGGGRVVIYYSANQFLGTLATQGGIGAVYGGAGTIYLKGASNEFAQVSIANGGVLGAITPWNYDGGFDLTISNGAEVELFQPPYFITINSLNIGSNGLLTYSTNAAEIAPLPMTIYGNADIQPGGAIILDGQGYAGGTGLAPGQSISLNGEATGGGGGSGGQGGPSLYGAAGGRSYQSFTRPSQPGSVGGAGFAGPGGAGGGVFNVLVGGTLQVDGSITANGVAGPVGGSGGGGGGGIILNVQTLSGGGTISANGGAGDPLLGGGGGGGSVAISSATNEFTGTISAYGGSGANFGGPGTIYETSTSNTGPTQVIVDNDGATGPATPIAGLSGGAVLTSRGGATVSLTPDGTFGGLMIQSSSSVIVTNPNPNTLSVTGNVTIATGGSLVLLNGTNGGQSTITVAGTLSVNGALTANGSAGIPVGGAGGRGGSISLTVSDLAGSGLISANGGAGDPPSGNGGNGGSISVYPATNQFTGVVTAHGGSGAVPGAAGSIYFGANGTNVAQLTLDNGGQIANSPTVLTNVSILHNLTITGGARGLFNAIGVPSTVNLQNLFIGSNSWLAVTSTVYAYTVVTSVNASNVTIQAGGGITLDGNGYPGGQGPGAGHTQSGSFGTAGGGGGHGGNGGTGGSNSFQGLALGGAAYGTYTTTETSSYGSGGGSGLQGVGGSGGGALELTAGTLDLEGLISANGNSGLAQNSGGGGGGGVHLSVGLFMGAGVISANGGAGDLPLGGGGAGGRIAVAFKTNLFAGALTAYGGLGENYGGAGTIYMGRTTTIILPPLPPPELGGPAGLIIDNGGNNGASGTPLAIAVTPVGLTTYNLFINGGGVALAATESSLALANLIISSNSWLVYTNYSGIENVSVSSNATIQAGCGILLDSAGQLGGAGTGGGLTANSVGGGGGYGGAGGSGTNQLAAGGSSYGSLTQISGPGSGGGAGVSGTSGTAGGAGGGALDLTVNRTLLLNGKISANGGAGIAQNSGGGSGGGLELNVVELDGSGLISANGGAGDFPVGGGGGGGRIFIMARTNHFAGGMTAYGGVGANAGGAGTIYLAPTSQGAQMVIDNGGINGSNTPLTQFGSFSSLIIGGGARAVGPGGTVGTLLINSNGWLGPNTSPALPESLALTVTSNATIQAGGGIVADATGNPGGGGTGPGAGSSVGAGGGGFGGYGGNGKSGALGGSAYGQSSVVQTFPTYGSGGGLSGPSGSGGTGGGAVQLIVNGALLLNGLVSANGGRAPLDNGGGGSGGYISLQAQSLSGNGTIAANGGAGDSIFGGGGGGGRIVINCASNSFTGGAIARGGAGANYGGAGTVFITSNLNALGQLIVDNGGFTGADTPVSQFPGNPAPPFGLTVSGDAIVFPTAGLVLSNLTVKSGAKIIGGIDLSNVSNPGYTVTLTVIGNTLVDSNSAIAVDNQGYNGGSGPGAGQDLADGYGGGGGYGGAGGASSTGSPGGVTYGSASQPTNWGSGGGFSPGAPNFCQGGGAIQLMIGGDLTLNGALSANGNEALFGGGGGGAGGSVWVTSRQLDGNGSVRANGGAGYPGLGGGGGGGRIAINTLTDNFTGLLAALGGPGYLPGQNGTVVTSTIPPPQVIAQSPTGTVFYAVSNVLLTFGSPMSLGQVTGANITVDTPNGPLPAGSAAVEPASLYSLQVSFTPQNTIGYYDVQAGPQIQDIYGVPLSPTYVGSWVILPPIISGQVTDTNGQPVPYVTLHPTGGLDPVLTDVNGDYSLEVLPSWTGTITPSKGQSMFLPASRSYTGVSGDMTNQNFVVITPTVMTLSATCNGSTMSLSHYAIQGVTYQILYSTDMVNWQPYTGPYVGTNGWMGMSVPASTAPALFYKFSASY